MVYFVFLHTRNMEGSFRSLNSMERTSFVLVWFLCVRFFHALLLHHRWLGIVRVFPFCFSLSKGGRSVSACVRVKWEKLETKSSQKHVDMQIIKAMVLECKENERGTSENEWERGREKWPSTNIIRIGCSVCVCVKMIGIRYVSPDREGGEKGIEINGWHWPSRRNTTSYGIIGDVAVLGGYSVFVYECVSVCVCVRACIRASVRVSEFVWACVAS